MIQGTASDRLPALLDEIRSEQLCVSLLFDKKCCHWNAVNEQHHVNIPAHDVLKSIMTAFKEMQCVSEAEAKEIEQGTRDQRRCSFWFSVRRNKITASNTPQMYIVDHCHLLSVWGCHALLVLI